MTVTARLPFGQTRVVLPGVTIAAADLESNAVETVKIKDAAVTSGKVADGAVTAPKVGNSTLGFSAFTGKNGAGACTLASALQDDVVVGVVSITDGTDAGANFESVITVQGEIQQSSSSNLSAKKFAVLLIKKGA